MNKTHNYNGAEIVEMHNPSGKLKYYVKYKGQISNQEWPTRSMAEKVIRTVIELE